MKHRRVFHYHRPGDLAGLEAELNAMSEQGWQALRPGRLVQVYVRGEGTFVHRLGYCAPGAEAAYTAAQTAAGWEIAARRRGWILFRRPREEGEAPRLEEDREPVKALFARRIARLETLRRWLLILSALLLIGGYAVSLRPVIAAAALPLAVILFISYRIKFMEEGTAR